MAVTVRPVDLDVEERELLGVLERNLVDLAHSRRFKWLYRDNPLGPAWSWFACDTVSRQAVGAASVFRRALWLGSEVRVCGQVGDFAIDPSYRSLGPALMLQRATFQPVARGDLALCYDCPPHDRGMSTFRRLGMTASATMRRYARLLRTDRQLGRRLGSGVLAACAIPFGNALLRAAALGSPRSTALELALHEDPFGDEFTDLDRRVGARDVIRSRRTAADLNWRYRDDPLHEYEVLTARRRGELLGFAVLAVIDDDAFIVDLFGNLCSNDAGELLKAAAERLRGTKTETLHAPVSDGSGLTTALRRSGFRLRDHGPRVVAYAEAGGQARALLDRSVAWDLTHSDVMA